MPRRPRRIDQSRRVGRVRRVIAHIPIEVAIARIELRRILLQPTLGLRVVVARPVVLQAGVAVELPAGVLVAVAGRRAGLARHPAVGVVGDRVLEHAATVQQVAHAPLAVGQVEHQRAGAAGVGDAGEDLVHGVGEEVAGLEGVAAVQVGPDVAAVVGEAGHLPTVQTGTHAADYRSGTALFLTYSSTAERPEPPMWWKASAY